jgi:hypothetical protein
MSFGFGFGFPRRWPGAVAWTPAQIPTSLWLDATDTSTITLNGSTVSQWNDKSGNGRNATQATAANQPAWGVGRNLFVWSEAFDNASWTKVAMTVTADVGSAPNGTNTADKIVPSTGVTAHVVFNATAISVVNGIATWTIRAKASEYNFLTIGAVVPAGRYSATFNLTTGATTKTATSGSPTSTGNSAKSLGNGWWEFSITATTTTATASYILLGASASGTPTQDGSLNVTDAGDGVSGILIWGAQLNPGTTADPYQQTTSAAQTLSTGINGKATLSWPNVANPRSIRVASNVPVQDFYCVTQYADGVQATWISGNAGLFGGDGGSSYIGLIGNNTTDSYWYNFCNFQNIRKNGGAVQVAGTGTAVALPMPASIINGTETTISRNTPMDIGMDRDLNALSRGWNGMIGEVIALSTTATTATRQLIEGYLAWKWGGF